MMYWVKKWIIWICRWRHCRGFGVQSPSDYSFIRYVINEHYPYYAYDELRTALPDICKFKRKKSELIFRIANYKQAQSATILFADDIYPRYLLSGCHKTTILNHFDRDTTLVVASALGIDDSLDILNHLRHGSLLVIDVIDNSQGRKVWKNIVSDERATITFDLYYMGIVLIFDNRYKQNYIVNF
ncbi:MAG: hypothetical protein ACI4T5_04660 [Prevotella sp.]